MDKITINIVSDYDINLIKRGINYDSLARDNIDLIFDENYSGEIDFFIIVSGIKKKLTSKCREAWFICQEPPTNIAQLSKKSLDSFDIIFSPEIIGNKTVLSHGALPWSFNKSYKDLINITKQKKTRRLSFITSNKGFLEGHRERLDFMHKISDKVDFDLYGRGFNEIDDKWIGLAPYKYSLAIENYSGKFYWSEKLSDCFLSWTMPIYFGCTNLEDYFPKESFFRIDIRSQHIVEQINEVINSNLYLENQVYIKEARELVLNEYQMLPFICRNFNKQTLPDVSTKQFAPYRQTFFSKLLKLCRGGNS